MSAIVMFLIIIWLLSDHFRITEPKISLMSVSVRSFWYTIGIIALTFLATKTLFVSIIILVVFLIIARIEGLKTREEV